MIEKIIAHNAEKQAGQRFYHFTKMRGAHRMSLRWGIIGTGEVAVQMAEALAFIGSPVTAVASRKAEKAERFGQKFGIPAVTTDYGALCGREDVDVVYIDLPHTLHREAALCALKHGKHVLCEKPIGVNRREAEEMFSYARERGLMLMEAMWSRHLPLLNRMVALARSGELGAARLFKADFTIDEGMRFPNHRLVNPELAGGALLDTGIYPLTVASMLFGDAPEILFSQAHLSGGVDMDNCTVLGYANGERAILYSGISGVLPEEGLIVCERGYIRLREFFYTQRCEVCRNGVVETVEEPFPCNGYEFQLRHMEECVEQGLTQSPVVSHQCSLNMMELMDRLRRQWGLQYPGERGEEVL